MKAVLLSLGPSLNLYDGDFEGVTIGVKRAATKHRCDFWACLDIPALRRDEPNVLGTPRLYTRAEYRPRYSTKPGPTVEEVSAWCGIDVGQFTATAGLALAGWMEAESVTVYGVDWLPGAADFDGYMDPEMRRTAERFERERALWDSVVAFLAGRGTNVERITGA